MSVDGVARQPHVFTNLEQVQWTSNSFVTWIKDCYQSFCDFKHMGSQKIEEKWKLDLVDFSLKKLFSGIFGNAFGFVGSITINLVARSQFNNDTTMDKHEFSNDKFAVIDAHSARLETCSFTAKTTLQYLETYPTQNIILPVCVEKHIVSVYIDQTQKKIYYYDPQGFAINPVLLKELESLSKTKGYALGTLTDSNKLVPHKQHNRTDCGVIAIEFMKHLLKGGDNSPENFHPDFEHSSEHRIQKRLELNNSLQPIKEALHKKLIAEIDDSTVETID